MYVQFVSYSKTYLCKWVIWWDSQHASFFWCSSWRWRQHRPGSRCLGTSQAKWAVIRGSSGFPQQTRETFQLGKKNDKQKGTDFSSKLWINRSVSAVFLRTCVKTCRSMLWHEVVLPGRLTVGSGSSVFLRNSVRVCRLASFSSMLVTNGGEKNSDWLNEIYYPISGRNSLKGLTDLLHVNGFYLIAE